MHKLFLLEKENEHQVWMCAYIQTQRWLCHTRTETSNMAIVHFNLHKNVHLVHLQG